MVFSLRRRLLFLLLGAIVSTWMVSIAMTSYFAQKTIIEQVDRQLFQYMNMMDRTINMVLKRPVTRQYFWSRVTPLISDGVARLTGDTFSSSGTDLVSNLWIEDVQVLSGIDVPRFSKADMTEGQSQNLKIAGSNSLWRVMYRRHPEHGISMAVAIDLHSAIGQNTTLTLRPLIPLFVVLPLTIVLLWWGINKGLAPLSALTEKVESRGSTVLEPIEMVGVPREVHAVVEAINGLLERLKRALESESRFTSNAAHELQTPLASIKAEVQRYQRHCPDPDTCRMLDRISTRVSRAAETVTQLLTLARLDPDQTFDLERVQLDKLTLDVIAHEGNWALDKNIALNIDALDEVVLYGHTDWLQVLIGNLLINAFKYCPEGGQVWLSSSEKDHQVTFSVANECEKVPSELFARLKERFFTVPTVNQSGVGLGLSIVQRIATLHNADVRLSPMKGDEGFKAEVIFHLSGSSHFIGSSKQG